MRTGLTAIVVAALIFGLGCSAGATPAATPCDRACMDATALRAMREMLKLGYNLTLQGKPVGAHDETTPCLKGGTARVFGEAHANPDVGVTAVDLTYDLDRCTYAVKNADPAQAYEITLTGRITEKGNLAAQSGATTALVLKSASLSLTGTVRDPPLPYEERECVVDVVQNGAAVTGSWCGRTAGFSF